MERLTLIRPDDFHLHLRDGAAMADALVHSARVFGRAIIMPNLKPPIASIEEAWRYRRRILDALPEGSAFEPMMTLYLTDHTSIDEIRMAAASGVVAAVKLYPAGATTNSDEGVTDLEGVMPAIEVMQEVGLPLLVHGEVTEPEVDPFDREKVFVDRILVKLVESFADLKVVLEHVTTAEGVQFVETARSGVAGTVTPHHLLLNRGALFAGGLRPHHYCLPVLKREEHREALVTAVTAPDSRFFLGTDSAPHPRSGKESDCCCAGVFNAHAAVEVCCEVFEQAGALDRLEAFTSTTGAGFYGIAANRGSVTLEKRPWKVPSTFAFGEQEVVPLRAGEEVSWRLV